MGVANLALRGAQVVITVAELGLSAYTTYRAFQTTEVCQYDSFENAVICTDIGGGGISGIGAFLLFNCVWTMIILAVLCLVPLCTKLHPIAVAVIDGLTMLFWFSGAVGFAVIVGTAASYYGGGQGLAIPDAMAGLAFLIWLLFLASFILNVRAAHKDRKGRFTQNYGPGAHQQYGQATPSPGMNNFPPQSPYAAQPQGPPNQGTYVQPMQQQSPVQSPGPHYQQPMHQQSPVQSPGPHYQQPMHQQSPVPSPGPQYQQQYQPPPPQQQYQQPMNPQQYVSPVSPAPNHHAQGPAGSNSAYYNQNPELGHA